MFSNSTSSRLEVRAYNNFDGVQEKEDRAIVTVIVNDVNDERPKFKHNRFVTGLGTWSLHDSGRLVFMFQ